MNHVEIAERLVRVVGRTQLRHSVFVFAGTMLCLFAVAYHFTVRADRDFMLLMKEIEKVHDSVGVSRCRCNIIDKGARTVGNAVRNPDGIPH